MSPRFKVTAAPAALATPAVANVAPASPTARTAALKILIMAHSLLAAAQLRWMAALGERRLDGSGRWPLVTTPKGQRTRGRFDPFFLAGLEDYLSRSHPVRRLRPNLRPSVAVSYTHLTLP